MWFSSFFENERVFLTNLESQSYPLKNRKRTLVFLSTFRIEIDLIRSISIHYSRSRVFKNLFP